MEVAFISPSRMFCFERHFAGSVIDGRYTGLRWKEGETSMRCFHVAWGMLVLALLTSHTATVVGQEVLPRPEMVTVPGTVIKVVPEESLLILRTGDGKDLK